MNILSVVILYKIRLILNVAIIRIYNHFHNDITLVYVSFNVEENHILKKT